VPDFLPLFFIPVADNRKKPHKSRFKKKPLFYPGHASPEMPSLKSGSFASPNY